MEPEASRRARLTRHPTKTRHVFSPLISALDELRKSDVVRRYLEMQAGVGDRVKIFGIYIYVDVDAQQRATSAPFVVDAGMARELTLLSFVCATGHGRLPGIVDLWHSARVEVVNADTADDRVAATRVLG
jgi:hypothetical protein